VSTHAHEQRLGAIAAHTSCATKRGQRANDDRRQEGTESDIQQPFETHTRTQTPTSTHKQPQAATSSHKHPHAPTRTHTHPHEPTCTHAPTQARTPLTPLELITHLLMWCDVVWMRHTKADAASEARDVRSYPHPLHPPHPLHTRRRSAATAADWQHQRGGVPVCTTVADWQRGRDDTTAGECLHAAPRKGLFRAAFSH
jgi:hypothetical protein